MAPTPTKAPAMTAADNGVNWANINTEVEHAGKKIVLPAEPGKMELEVAIETLERVKEQEAQKFDVFEVVEGAPWDALQAIYVACQRIYGVVTSHSIQTWFGEIKPQFATINTGPGEHDKIQVPKGQMRVPGVSEPFYLDFAGAEGAFLKGTVNKKDQTRLVEIANLARQIIRSDSIYKSKAIRLSVDDDGDLVLNSQPEFLDLSKVQETDIIHTRETEQLIRTNVFSPLKNTAACRKHRIPLKRGILLEGTYGTGKSLTARVTAKVATDNGWTFIMLDRSQGLKAAIEFARAYQPCVIFAEDIERAADRSEEGVNDLVNLIDGMVSKTMEMMIVLTTNFIEKIDKALLRPGRFDAVLSIAPPDSDTVQRLIRAYSRDLLEADAQLGEVGDILAGRTPADIREVVERSKLTMLSEDRSKLLANDLYVTALGMQRHLDLLKPATPTETSRDKFVNGLLAVLAEAGMGEGTDLTTAIANDGAQTRSMLKASTNAVRRDVVNANSTATAAADSATQAKDLAKKILDRV